MGAGAEVRTWLKPSIVLAIASLALHALANSRYGFFRDELYFIVCGNNPDWGYADQPALVPLLAAWSHAIFGNWLWGFRLLPMAVMAATVGLTTEFTRFLGGKLFAQWLCGLCMLFAPIFLLQGTLFFTDMFQPLTWLALGWILIRLEQTGDERWWLVFGAVAGFSLNTKYLVAFYLMALALALLCTPSRRSLLRPWPYVGALIASAMILPNVLWQHAHGWPFLELGKAGAAGKNIALPPAGFFLQQIFLIGPSAAVVWIAGLWAGMVRPTIIVARVFPIAWLFLFWVFDLSHGKPYYLSSIYPTLLALGAVRIESWIGNVFARRAFLAVITVSGLAVAPLTLPILPVDLFIRYQNVIGYIPSTGEHQKLSVLPQYYADMFGWPEMTKKVADVYWSLSSQERAHAAFFGNNYGEAAAIDVFGSPLGLPPAVSGHNNYYIWGPRDRDGSVLIIIGGSPKHYASLFRSFQTVGHVNSPYAMPYETGKPIYVLRGMKEPLATYWPQVKSYQ